MRQPLVLALVTITSLGLAACATPNPIQTDRTAFNFDSTFQRAAYSQPIETTFDKTVTVFREAGYALDIVDRATGQISGQRGKTGDKGASKNNDMRFVALILPGVGGGSQLALKFVQVSNVGVPVLNRTQAEVVLSQPELYAYVFRRVDDANRVMETPPAALAPISGPTSGQNGLESDILPVDPNGLN
jgi:hypothetical protein